MTLFTCLPELNAARCLTEGRPQHSKPENFLLLLLLQLMLPDCVPLLLLLMLLERAPTRSAAFTVTNKQISCKCGAHSLFIIIVFIDIGFPLYFTE